MLVDVLSLGKIWCLHDYLFDGSAAGIDSGPVPIVIMMQQRFILWIRKDLVLRPGSDDCRTPYVGPSIYSSGPH